MRRRRKAFWRLTIVAAFASLVACAALFSYAQHRLSRLVLGGLGESFSTRVYAAPFWITESTRQSSDQMLDRLRRLGYKITEDPVSAGQYAWDEPVLSIYVRGFETPHESQGAVLVLLTRQTDNAWKIKAAGGRELERVALEPELAAELSGAKKVRRSPAQWEEIPRPLVQAVMAAEDKRFMRHWGVDPFGLMRAAWLNLTHRGGGLQGGSTITQQLAKNLLLNPQRTFRRKAMEIIMAFYLEIRYSKAEIMTLYLNHVYWGQDGSFSIAGAKAAAYFYFGKHLKDLTVSECAGLAGMIRSPYKYNPRRSSSDYLARRNFVLRRMADEEWLTDASARELAKEGTGVGAPPANSRAERDDNAYFTAEVVRQLVEKYGEEALFHYGMTIHTTMDPLMQKAAQSSLRLARHQGALVALDPYTGRVLALSGGKDYRESQFNRATQARRQPGSAFKPFVYGAAMQAGFTPSTFILDEPKKFPKGTDIFWQPKNYGEYHGTTTVRNALALSMNAATLDLAQKTGAGNIVAFARIMGIMSPLNADLSIALGSFEVTPLELTAAYAAFVNGGFRVSPHFVTSVTDAQGDVLEFLNFQRSEAITPALSYLMTSLMQSVVTEGTAKSLAQWGWNRTSAGKTGTTNKGRDAWFIGYTPELLAGVWAGNDQDAAVGGSGARDAIPIWASFMKDAVAGYPQRPFEEPSDIKRVDIDPESGLIAVSGCPQRKEEVYLAGSEPKKDCPVHSSGLGGWLKRIFK